MFSIKLLAPSQISTCLHMTFPRYRQDIQQSKNIIAIAGMHYGVPVACVFSNYNPKSNNAFIYSIFVREAYRNKGIATLLMESLEEELKNKKCQKISTFYEENEFTQYVQSILARYDWQKPSLKEILYEIKDKDVDEYMSAPWVAENLIPSDFTVIEWSKLSETQLQQVKTEIADYPLGYSPFIGTDWDDIPSLALYKDGKIWGWALTSWVTQDALAYNILFVYPELQKMGVAIALLGESVRRCYHKYRSHRLSRYMAITAADNSPMIHFIENGLSPYLSKIVYNYEVEKILTV